MDKNRIAPVIRFFIEELKNSGLIINGIVLFGSYSTGTANEQSDIDITIVSEQFEGLEFSKRFHFLGKSIVKTVQKYHIPFDVIPLTLNEYKNEKSIRMDFIRNGISLDPQTLDITTNHLAEA